MTGAYTEEFLKDILERALDALENGRRQHIYRWDDEKRRRVVFHLERDLHKLNSCCPDFPITTEQCYWGIILDCLEAALEDPLGTFKHPEEPICSHKEAFELEMYAFVVQLEDFTRPIYTKFCLKEQRDGTWYVSIDCHP